MSVPGGWHCDVAMLRGLALGSVPAGPMSCFPLTCPDVPICTVGICTALMGWGLPEEGRLNAFSEEVRGRTTSHTDTKMLREGGAGVRAPGAQPPAPGLKVTILGSSL